MWAFQYKHGDRPLEGFTIQRAAGREVAFRDGCRGAEVEVHAGGFRLGLAAANVEVQ